VRIGTWNLNWGLSPASERRSVISDYLANQAADIWLLTEVHEDWQPGTSSWQLSPHLRVPIGKKRWAGIRTDFRMGGIRTAGDPSHPAEEALCLARLELDGVRPSSVLVACSVLPWKGAGAYWRGLPDGQLNQFRCVLDHHHARIAAERDGAEPLIWGGDFNQPLIGPFWGATQAGAEDLRAAFEKLGLVALTQHAEHLNGQTHAIDHIAVSRELVIEGAVADVHRPVSDTGRPLSDHAAYTADIALQ
jgi:hypothetical protein